MDDRNTREDRHREGNRLVPVRVTGACLLFVLQRGSEGGERGVVVSNELSEEVFDEV